MFKKKVLDIAHRGASGSKPENTKISFLEAIKLKADVIEFDVHKTKDNQIVVIHDSTINRTSNGTGKVSSLTLKEIKSFNFGTSQNPQTILTLKEALQLIGKKAIIIVELKKTVKGFEHLVLKDIERIPQHHHIWIHSAYFPILKNVRKLNPDIKLGYIVYFSYFHHLFRNYYKHLSQKYNISFFSIDAIYGNQFFIQDFITELQQEKIQVFTWTVNDFTTMNKVIDWDVDGIISNYPGLVKKAIKEQSSSLNQPPQRKFN